jgi:acyl-CoA synthetase (NDP forming)/RimJ/RimL family protein N-acetyltransferase
MPDATTREGELVLRDGSTVHLRPVRATDKPALLEFYGSLSRESRRLRFFTAGTNVEWAANWAASADGESAFGLVATTGAAGEIVGHGAWVRIDESSADVALELSDRTQGRGLGTLMVAELAGAAAAAGLESLVADVLPDNHPMLEVFRECGYPASVRSVDGNLKVELRTSATGETLHRFEERDRVAAQAAVRHVLEPSSVAVVGAGRGDDSVGGRLFRNLLRRAPCPVYPVNPQAGEVADVRAHSSVTEIDEEVELAVIAVPAGAVVAAARDCAAKGVRALIVVSAGFAESGPEGATRQRELVEVCRASGMRLVGPNCLGAVNAWLGLHATFADCMPTPGRVGLMSQSGGVALALVEEADRLGLGVSSFVSVGNKADISGNDLLQYWEGDPHTDLVMMYLESLGNPRKFARIARRVSRSKPIVAVKAGSSAAGRRAGASHTGALLASDAHVEALFRQTGVIRVDDLGELFEVAGLLSRQPAPSGRRVAVVTNAGGPAILCADACEAAGLNVAEPSVALRRSLREAIPAAAALGNPLDLLASAGPHEFRAALAAIAESGEFDAAIAIFTSVLGAAPDDIENALEESLGSIPLVAVFLPTAPRTPPRRVPRYRLPESAARALARAATYGEWRAAPEDPAPELYGLARDEAHALLARALEDGPRWLTPAEVDELLGCYGLALADWRFAADADAAARAASELAGAVALKGVAAQITHKSDVGAVRLGLETPDEVAEAAREMASRLELEGFVVQRMAGEGVEMLAGITRDPLFGALVACAAGGRAVELLRDASVRIAPLGRREAGEMVRSLRTFPLLDGYRGAPPADVSALEDVLLRLGVLADEHPQVAELDCNPVLVGTTGAKILDARVRVETPAVSPPWPAIGAPPPRLRDDY